MTIFVHFEIHVVMRELKTYFAVLAFDVVQCLKKMAVWPGSLPFANVKN